MKKFVPRPSIIHFVAMIENVDDSILDYTLEYNYRFAKIESRLLGAISESHERFIRGERRQRTSISQWGKWQRDIYCIRRDYPDFGTHFYPKISHRIERLKLDLTIRLIRVSTPCTIFITDEYQVASIDNDISVSSYKQNSEVTHQDEDIVPLTEQQIRYSRRFIENVLAKSDAKTETDSEKKLQRMLDRPFFHPSCDLAFQNFELSFSVKNSGLAFLALITTLEVLFGSGAHRVARNAAIVLGKNKEESKFLYERLLALHEKRSKFLHSGRIDEITPQDVLECRDYCRRCIVEVYEINLPRDGLLKILNTMGFGDRPALGMSGEN
jgi:hypothetical protein